MKKTVFITIIAFMAVSFAFLAPVLAKDEEKAVAKEKTEAANDKEAIREAKKEELDEKNPISSREAGYLKKINERLENMQKEFDAEVSKLEAILTAAREEDASKTAALVEALIKEKTDEFNKQVEHFKEMRDKMLSNYRDRFQEYSKRREKIESKREEYIKDRPER